MCACGSVSITIGFSIVAATLPPGGGRAEVHRVETTRVAIRWFIDRLGGAEGLAVCYEAGPGGFRLAACAERARGRM
jgi:hypothetical protein